MSRSRHLPKFNSEQDNPPPTVRLLWLRRPTRPSVEPEPIQFVTLRVHQQERARDVTAAAKGRGKYALDCV